MDAIRDIAEGKDDKNALNVTDDGPQPITYKFAGQERRAKRRRPRRKIKRPLTKKQRIKREKAMSAKIDQYMYIGMAAFGGIVVLCMIVSSKTGGRPPVDQYGNPVDQYGNPLPPPGKS